MSESTPITDPERVRELLSRVDLFQSDLNDLRRIGWRTAASEASGQHPNETIGVLASWAGDLAWMVFYSQERKKRAEAKYERLSRLEEEVDAHMDIIRDADPDLAERLDGIVNEGRPEYDG